MKINCADVQVGDRVAGFTSPVSSVSFESIDPGPVFADDGVLVHVIFEDGATLDTSSHFETNVTRG